MVSHDFRHLPSPAVSQRKRLTETDSAIIGFVLSSLCSFICFAGLMIR